MSGKTAYYSKMSRVLFSVWFTIQGIIQNTTCSVWFRIPRINKKMSRVLFSFWFTIQGIIQNTTCSVWFWIQRIIENCPGYYSASGSVFSILFKIVQIIVQRLVQDSAYSRCQHRSRIWEASRMSQPGLSGLNGAQAAGKSRESKIAQK